MPVIAWCTLRHTKPTVSEPHLYLFDLDGGRACLDFANTQTASDDHLATYADLVAFAAQSNLIPPPTAAWLHAAAQRAPQVQSLASSVMGVPVHVVPGAGATTSTGRDNDFAPFNAGGYMISPSNGTTCSSGFAINLSGSTRITTARHCTRNDRRHRSLNLGGSTLSLCDFARTLPLADRVEQTRHRRARLVQQTREPRRRRL